MSRFLVVFVFALLGSLLVALTVWPEFDLAVSGLFASTDGFFLQGSTFLKGMTRSVFYGARILALFLVLAVFFSLITKKNCLGLSSKASLFLLLALLTGPGLMANVVFKDHWGRARPRDTLVFGGDSQFTPAFVMSDACKRNCSFVSGDASFGFLLPAFAYVVPRRFSRHVFWGGMGLGSVLSLARILLGAHFLSDVLAAMFLVLAISAGLFAFLFGRAEMQRRWREWCFWGP